jgi:hypothetical protein
MLYAGQYDLNRKPTIHCQALTADFACAEVAPTLGMIEVGERKVTKIIRIAMAILACCFGTSKAHADCSCAVSSYNSKLSDIESHLKRYARCVAARNGADDCSSEFRPAGAFNPAALSRCTQM